MTGSAQRCNDDDHGGCNHILAMAVPGVGLAIKDKSHGTTHRALLTIDIVIKALDPKGTSYRPVDITS